MDLVLDFSWTFEVQVDGLEEARKEERKGKGSSVAALD